MGNQSENHINHEKEADKRWLRFVGHLSCLKWFGSLPDSPFVENHLANHINYGMETENSGSDSGSCMPYLAFGTTRPFTLVQAHRLSFLLQRGRPSDKAKPKPEPEALEPVHS